MVIIIILEKVLNFLIPQQLSIIMDSLIDYREDTLPKELGKWFIYMWLASLFSLKPLKSFVEDKVMRHAEAGLCVPAFKHIMELSADYHQDNSTVERAVTIRQYKNVPAVIRQCLVYALPSLFDTAGSIWYLAHFDSYIAIAALSVWAVLCWGNLKLMTLLPRRFACQNNAESKEVQLLSDVLLNWATVIHFRKLENEAKRYHRAVLERLNNERRRLNTTHIISGIEFLHKDIILLPLAALVAQKVRNGTATPGDFTAFLTHWKRLWFALDSLILSFQVVSILLSTGARLETLSAQPSVTDKPGAVPLRITKGSIEFNNVSFEYNRKLFMSGISATVRGGQTVSLVGETGAGKTTLLRLLARDFNVVEGGSIQINSQNIREVILESLRRAIGII